MLKVEVDTFVMIMYFLNDKWEPYYITVGFFETINTFGNSMALEVNDVLEKYGFKFQIITYIKDEGGNLNTMTNALISTISYETLTCKHNLWGHVGGMQCQSALNMLQMMHRFLSD